MGRVRTAVFQEQHCILKLRALAADIACNFLAANISKFEALAFNRIVDEPMPPDVDDVLRPPPLCDRVV